MADGGEIGAKSWDDYSRLVPWSAPTKLVSPECQDAACDADRQVHVGWRKEDTCTIYRARSSFGDAASACAS